MSQGLKSHDLHGTIEAFNLRRYREAAALAAECLATAQGRDEVFWMGLLETCEGYELLMAQQWLKSERKLVAAMHKLRNFGYRYQNFEITAALAGIRLAVEQIRLVRQGTRRRFDVSLLPQLRLAAKADEQ